MPAGCGCRLRIDALAAVPSRQGAQCHGYAQPRDACGHCLRAGAGRAIEAKMSTPRPRAGELSDLDRRWPVGA